MSENVTKMPDMPDTIEETKSMTVAIDLDYVSVKYGKYEGTMYVVITGIPKDLPAEYEDTVVKTAEQQFAKALNDMRWLEIYPRGKSARDGEHPVFVNLRHLNEIKICGVRKFA